MIPRGVWLPAALLCVACPQPTPHHPLPRADAAVAARQVLFHARSAHGAVYVVREGSLRILRFGAADAEDQSAYDPSRPHHEPLEYVRTALLGAAYTGRPKRALMIGLGGGSWLRHLRRVAPAAELEAVEINPVVVKACRKFFGFAAAGKVRIHVRDGRRFVQRAASRYDLVFLDAYDSDDYPRHLGTKELFFEVRRLLTPKGVVVANLSPNERQRRDELIRTFRAVFPRSACFHTPVSRNSVLVGGPGVSLVDPRAFAARVQRLDLRTAGDYELQRAASQRCRFKVPDGKILRDRKP
ncbi:MAG: fused MFS/spermidine synthase [bacterium]